MKRSTAIARLGDVVQGLDRAAQWPDSTVVAAFVFGALLTADRDVERVQVAFVVDEPAAAVPWMSRPPRLEALADLLRFTKLPLSWRWRPVEWPVWNHEIDRAVRVWTAADGGEPRVVDALAAGRLDDVDIVGPRTAAELASQLVIERAVAREHLATVTERFYEQAWRRDHRGDGVHAEDHLWWAAAAFLDLDDATRRVEH